MIRVTWLQFRLQALVALAALAVLGIVLAITGASLHHLYSTAVLACHAGHDCSAASAAFLGDDHDMQVLLNVLVAVLPALIGLFWGAPLAAREFETGTYRLAWTQTTRTRWLGVKLAGIGLASMALAGIVSWTVTWWSSPLDAANMTLFTSFDGRDLVPLGYAAFAFVVGVSAGLFIRKTVPAMATTLAVFVPVCLAFARWVRPYLLPPQRLSAPDVLAAIGPPPPGGHITAGHITASSMITGGAQPPNPRDWLLSNQTVNASGHVIGTSGSIGSGMAGLTKNRGVVLGPGYSCPNITAPHRQLTQRQFAALAQKCVNQLHIRQVVTYQPVSHYWPLQWCEFAIFAGAALLLSGCCLWWARKRIG